MLRKSRILASLTLAVWPMIAAAENLSLESAIQRALDHNLELRAASYHSDAAQARADAAQVQFRPQVDARYMVRRSDNPLDAFADKLNTRAVTSADLSPAAINDPGASTVHATQLSIAVPLYTGGRVRAEGRAANQYAEAARLGYEHQRQATIYKTIQTYRSAQASAQAVRIADDAVAAAREHADTTARLVRQGRITSSDRLTAELNLASVEGMREQAALRERLALDELRQTLGMAAGAEINLPDWEDPSPSDVNLTSPDSEQQALAQRKDLQAQTAMLSASRTKIRAARSVFQPQVSVVAADSWYDENAALDNRSQSIMGVVSLNLFNGGRDWHGLTAAQQDAAEAEAHLQALQESIRNEVRSAANRWRAASARHRIAAQSIDKARETVRLVKQRYGEGRTILIDLLMSERVLVEARNEALSAGLEQELSLAQLELAEGSLKPAAASLPQ